MPTSASPQVGIYFEQHVNRETTLIVDSSNTIRGDGTFNLSSATVTLATGAIKASYLAGNLASGTIDLGPHLWNARELASAETMVSGSSAPAAFWGGFLYSETTPALVLTSSGDESAYLNWASNNVDGIKLPPVALPADISTAAGMTLELFGEVVGSASAADAIQAVQMKVWFGVGNANVGSTHPNFTTTPSWKGITIASGSMTTDIMNIILVPQAHAARPIRVYGARARYTRTS